MLHNNLRQVVHTYVPFVSDIAIFVLKGDVKLQLTNLCTSVTKQYNLVLAKGQ